ncbi:lanthionine synthetase LanC family protein [Sphingobacterium ginsenosidimutans]|uniref:Lantibiotic biosynthesis protein dehydration domain-containing protein n=1 Tax=Sphingobacterium ginsenosidimutans TaxID=687845 RepID=A0ABP7ZW45_9SPHI
MTTLFNSTQRQRLTEHLEQVTQHLLRACRQHQNGLYWLSPYYTSETTYDFKVTTDLFQGNSGIALFFLARYSYSGSQADLHIAQRTMDFVSDHLEQNSPQAFGLFTGLSGVIYTYIRLFELGGGQQYLDRAHALALSYQEQLVRQTIKADLLSGYSGSLFVLTLLQHYRPEPALIQLIQQLIDRLVSEARPSEKGLKWDYNQSKSAYDSLTGFSHGASGIAYILLEVAQYFNNKALLYLAEEVLLYEMQYFHADFDNWLDLRLGSHRLQTANIQHWELKNFLPHIQELNSWAHGAAGIGLARLAAWRATGKTVYLDQCRNIAQKCSTTILQAERQDYTVCSGYAGLLPFMLTYPHTAQEYSCELLLHVIDQAQLQYQTTGSYNSYISAGRDDYGLLSGAAGIGYSILQLLDSDMSSIFCPSLPPPHKSVQQAIKLNFGDLQRGLLEKYYPLTLQQLEQHPSMRKILDQENGLHDFENSLTEQLLQADPAPSLQAVFALEQTQNKLWKQHKGHLCYSKKNAYIKSKIQQLTDGKMLDLSPHSLILADHVSLYLLDEALRGALALPSDKLAVLFIADEWGVSSSYIGLTSMLIVQQVENTPLTGALLCDQVSNKLISMIGKLDEDNSLKAHISAQIRLLFESGILTTADV